MKKYINKAFILLSAVLLIGAGCTGTGQGFLDAKTENETLETIFSDSLKTIQFQASIYWKIPDVILGPRDPGNGYYLQSFKDYDSGTDNMRELNSTNKKEFGPAFTKNDFTQDGINANYSKFLNTWVAMYQNIRVCNQFVENSPRSPMAQAKKDLLLAETHFMRAFYYFHLLRNFGGVPLLGDEMLDPFINHGVPRSTFEETVEFIAKELKLAAAGLPHVQSGNDYGRPTKGAALAVLANLYFYAASPLYNGGNTGSGNNRLLVGYDSFDISRWQRAKDALDDFFKYNQEQGGLFELIEETSDTPDEYGNTAVGHYKATTSRVSKERVWFWVTYNGHTWPQGQLMPPSRKDGSSYYHLRIIPYHDLTEAFPTKDGVEIRPFIDGEYTTSPGEYNEDNALYNPEDPYANRDPRFYNAFLFNNALWSKIEGGTPTPVYTYRGASQDGIFGTSATSTGYYFVKLCKKGVTGKSSFGEKSGQGVAFLRYAELMLMDAEIMTELDVDANRAKIEEHLIAIRRRAGITPGSDMRYGIPQNMNKEEMLAFIINERRIEFVLEGGKRFWDLKRRKLFDKLNNKWSHAAVWDKASNDEVYSWAVQPIEQHYFGTRQYHFPIPLKEIEASQATLIQNPGW